MRRALGLVLSVAPSAALALPAFPGADGPARAITGGRGGIVYHVTSLAGAYNDPNRAAPGTLAYGLNDANFPANTARTIVFDVGGTINLGSWDSQCRFNLSSKNVTLAGHTAPGGIAIMGGLVKASGSNVIFRNVTIAPGYGNRGIGADGIPDSYVYDAIDITGQNMIFDHVSTFFATDEHISANETANNITVQWSNISQGQNYPQMDTNGSYTGHAFGSLLQMGTDAKLSVHHNLYAHQKGRLPRVGSTVGTGAINDFRNNVFYNWLSTAGSGASGQPSFNNFVGNFYLAGAGGDNAVGGTTPDITWTGGGTGIFSGASATATRVYHAANLKDTNKDGDASDGVALANADFGSSTFVTTAYDAGYVGVTDSATVAFDRVLNYMGANWWTRDAVIDTVDERIVAETRAGTGQIIAWADNPGDPSDGAEWYALLNRPMQTRPANWDTDGDGMPDAWERELGLNALVANNNADFDADGYTDIEEYLNDLAAWPAPRPQVFTGGTGGRYALSGNWDIDWQPSRYDTVLVNGGSAVIDAVGQDARTIRLATTAGSTASLLVSAGRLHVREDLEIATGANASGTLTLAGGKLLVRGTIRGGAGTTRQLQMLGGTLAAGTLDATNLGGTISNVGSTLSPGDDGIAGRASVIGHYSAGSNATLRIDLGGTTPANAFQDAAGRHDRLVVTGNASLDGSLLIALIDGFTPAAADTFSVASAGNVSGGFANANPWGLFSTLDGSGAFVLQQTAASITLRDFTRLGDVSLDGTINNQDIAPFVALLTGGPASGVVGFAADVNGDGVVNNQDIAPFVALLTGGRPVGDFSGDPDVAPLLSLVPEPGAIALLGLLLGVARRRRTA